MTDAASPASGAVTCANCLQPLPPGAARCIWCGVARSSAAPALVMAPGGLAPGALAPQGVPPAPGAPALVAPVGAASLRVAPPAETALGAGFRGTIAPTGSRLAAFAIDLVLISAVAVVVLLVTASAAFAALGAVELVIGSWVMQARTGATAGQRVLRLRTSRAESPFSPGAVPSLVRFAITGAGFALLGVGSWLIVASGVWDPARRGRSIADRATRTIVVSAPARGARPAPGPVTAPVVAPATSVPPAAHLAPPAVPSAASVGIAAAPVLLPPPMAAQPAPAPSVLAPPQPTPTPIALAEPQVLSTRRPSTPIDDVSASVPSAVVPEEPIFETVAVQRPVTPSGDALLLIFDTGQREQVALPAAINLGRNPVAAQEGDALISVRDPDATVSKTHARVEHIDGETWVSDGGSTNGTEVISDEGVVTVLVPGVRTRLDDGARIRIGKRAFTVSVLVGGAS